MKIRPSEVKAIHQQLAEVTSSHFDYFQQQSFSELEHYAIRACTAASQGLCSESVLPRSKR